jgi:hypothetical protein
MFVTENIQWAPFSEDVAQGTTSSWPADTADALWPMTGYDIAPISFGGHGVNFGYSLAGMAFLFQVPAIVSPTPPVGIVWPFPTGLLYSREYYSMNLVMVRANSFAFTAQVLNNGTPVNITDCSFKFMAKRAFTDLDGDAVFVKTVGTGITKTAPLTGTLQVALQPADTVDLPDRQIVLVYDLQMKTAASEIYTVLRGKLTVNPSVVEAT